MNNNYHWHQYLFESHSEVTLRQWAKRLQKFRFVRAYGGHANDGDSLVVVYGYNGLWDLQRFFDLLGVQLVVHRQKPAQREPGISYTWEAYDSFPSLIPGTCWVEQPWHCLIGGQGGLHGARLIKSIYPYRVATVSTSQMLLMQKWLNKFCN